MDEDDFVMGEDGAGVVSSTEMNGDHVGNEAAPARAVSPDLNGHVRAPSPTIKEKHPTLSDYEPHLDVASPSSSHVTQNPPTSSDEMEVTYSRLSRVEIRVPPPPKFPPLAYPSSRTGLVYDARMRFHCEPTSFALMDDDIHPEDPRRIHEIFQEIQQAGLVQGPDESEEDAKEEQCWRIHARAATKGEICLVHTPAHYDYVESLQEKSESELKALSDAMDSIYFNNSTFDCARLAAGGAIEACRAVVRGDVRNAIAIIRPPGHHAECDQPSGFCIFNNVPIATRVCQNDFPNECRKVLILDWDVHHGNGIQHAFYQDPNVLYISLHVFNNGTFYPNLPDGDLDYCGEGPGVGKNVNIPWSEIGMGDAEYIYAFQEVVVPIATEFDPDLVIISAGFDAAEGDVLGGCHVTPACYAHMTHMLMRLAKGKMAVCLEGGYNLRSIARSALAVTRTLMLQPPDRLAEDLGPPKDVAVRTIERVKREQSKYWKCMFPKQPDKNSPTYHSTQRLHDIIREWQSKILSTEHQMVPLTIKKSGIAQTFEHNVIATFMEPYPLLVIFHDPPSVMNRPDPVTGNVELHNIWLTDVTKSYIDWAIENGFQVIDVNIPRVVYNEDDEVGFIPSESAEIRAAQTKILANYLWENYIEPHDATQVFLMGVGAAYIGLVDLLSNNESTTEGRGIERLIGFVSETPVQSIRRHTDDNISEWFFKHSLVFVAHGHHAWDPTRIRRLRRKYGNLKRSNHHLLNDMLQEHKEEVKQLLLRLKNEYEEETNSFRLADEQRGGLKSPPLTSGAHTASVNSESRRTSATPIRSPRLPQIGYFSAPSPRSPRSPMKRTA